MPNSSIIIDTTAEVLPIASEISASSLHNHYHHCAQAAAAQATGYAILCGLELQKIRAEIAKPGKRSDLRHSGDGGWESWVESNCEFGITTAKKYMAVAEGIKSRLGDEITGMIDFAPSALADGDREKLLKSVSKVTEGQTLQQLYMDFGITKKSSQDNLRKGGATHTKGRGNVANLDEQDARVMANHILKDLADWLHAGHHQHLPYSDVHHFDQQLLAAREMLKPYLKK